MIDGFERKHGPVEDRSIFDGEITVPPHLRNLSLTSIRANRLHGSIFGSLSRSRTFLNLTQNARHTFHGSVPDLSRNQFTLCNNDNQNSNKMMVDDKNGRRMSSTSTPASTITKITLNSSTTLAFNDESSGYLSNGNLSQYSSDHQMHSIESSSIESHDPSRFNGTQQKSNSIRSLNDIQLREMNENRTIYCQSLGRPNRQSQKTNVYTTKPADFKNGSRSQSMDAYQTEGYMTLIKTNVPPSSHTTYRSSINRAISPLCTITAMHDTNAIDSNSQMTNTTTTFQRKPPPQNSNRFNASGHFVHELSLNNMTKFKLPRVSLNHSTVTNPHE